jgi:uncharacterized membrane protein YeaQ/YmgE (transglycosylase-associated protein family)
MNQIAMLIAGAIIGFFAGIFFNEGMNKGQSNDKYYRD